MAVSSRLCATNSYKGLIIKIVIRYYIPFGCIWIRIYTNRSLIATPLNYGVEEFNSFIRTCFYMQLESLINNHYAVLSFYLSSKSEVKNKVKYFLGII
jgi:hypothetical protein